MLAFILPRLWFVFKISFQAHISLPEPEEKMKECDWFVNSWMERPKVTSLSALIPPPTGVSWGLQLHKVQQLLLCSCSKVKGTWCPISAQLMKSLKASWERWFWWLYASVWILWKSSLVKEQKVIRCSDHLRCGVLTVITSIKIGSWHYHLHLGIGEAEWCQGLQIRRSGSRVCSVSDMKEARLWVAEAKMERQ